MHPRRVVALLAAAMLAVAGCGRGEPRHVRLVTTTSVQDSGLLPAILPFYEKAAGAKVDVVAVGTGAAFKLAKDGNADLLLVHDRKGEEEFIAAGDGKERRPICWNTFEILGPTTDPAEAGRAPNAGEALARIARSGAAFVSRGDDSGTHRRELSLWKSAGGLTKWPAYREAGAGMGAALLVADETNAYVLADRGTALAFRRKLRIAPLLADTPELRNIYSVVVLDERRHPEIAAEPARRLADWLAGPEAEKLIEDFRVEGERLFHPTTGDQ
jgi:tungstate transport system substrate-binding protein